MSERQLTPIEISEIFPSVERAVSVTQERYSVDVQVSVFQNGDRYRLNFQFDGEPEQIKEIQKQWWVAGEEIRSGRVLKQPPTDECNHLYRPFDLVVKLQGSHAGELARVSRVTRKAVYIRYESDQQLQRVSPHSINFAENLGRSEE